MSPDLSWSIELEIAFNKGKKWFCNSISFRNFNLQATHSHMLLISLNNLVYKIYSDQFKCKHFFWEAKTNKVQEVMKYFINFPLTKIKNLQYSICFISNKFWYLVQNLRCFGLYWKIYLIYIFVLVYHICLREASKIKNRLNLWHCPNRGREVSASWPKCPNPYFDFLIKHQTVQNGLKHVKK